jgi:hypothetical protein
MTAPETRAFAYGVAWAAYHFAQGGTHWAAIERYDELMRAAESGDEQRCTDMARRMDAIITQPARRQG